MSEHIGPEYIRELQAENERLKKDYSVADSVAEDLINEKSKLLTDNATLRAENARLTLACEKEFADVQKLSDENARLTALVGKMREALEETTNALKICYADSHSIRVEYLREKGLDTVALVQREIEEAFARGETNAQAQGKGVRYFDEATQPKEPAEQVKEPDMGEWVRKEEMDKVIAERDLLASWCNDKLPVMDGCQNAFSKVMNAGTEIKELRAKLFEKEKSLASSCLEWAETDTKVKQLAESVGVQGDSNDGYFRTVEMVVEDLVNKLAEVEHWKQAYDADNVKLRAKIAELESWKEIATRVLDSITD